MIRARLILHGKAAQEERVRAAVQAARNDGHMVDVRVTWEAGDARRFTRDAVRQARQGEVDRIIAGGGDGTVNEVFATAYKTGSFGDCSFGVLPLGTANDFARSTGIPVDDLTAALRLSLCTTARQIDIGMLNETPFVNLVSGGFGSRVTAETDPALKSRLGGLAYLLTGMGRLREFTGCKGRFPTPDFSWEGSFIAMAIGNGRQAGGGIQLCPGALLNDGELDLMILPELSRDAGLNVLASLLHEGLDRINDLKIATRSPWIEFESDHDVSMNLDGEPIQVRRFRAECRTLAMPLHLGNDALMT